MTKLTMITAGLALVAAVHTSTWAVEQPEPPKKQRQLRVEALPWKGDFDEMLKRRHIRVLIPYSRTLYFNDQGRERGLSVELVRDFERYLNKKYAKQLGKRPLTVFVIPTTRDKLFSTLTEGKGDIAAANLIVTEDRLKILDFVAPKDRKPIQELIVTGPNSPQIASVEELSGRTLHVRQATSYYDSVVALNERLEKAGKPPVKIVALPDAIEDEDKLEMLNAGLFEFVIVVDWVARMWAQVLPKIKVRDDLVMRAEGYPGWGIRKDSPKLTEAIMDFYQNAVKKQGGLDTRIAQYHKRVRQITNNTGGEEQKRFETVIRFMEQYGKQYHFDPLMLAAQGYQESQLRQEARSHVGAIGVMQIMPATGKDLKVGDITQMEPNIHGGTKYMDHLMTNYFPDAKFTDVNRTLFAFASYNAGAGNISKMRKEAVKRGLDQDQWFNNVELVVADRIGMETTTYVRNIWKYYVAYKLLRDRQEEARKAREQLDHER